MMIDVLDMCTCRNRTVQYQFDLFSDRAPHHEVLPEKHVKHLPTNWPLFHQGVANAVQYSQSKTRASEPNVAYLLKNLERSDEFSGFFMGLGLGANLEDVTMVEFCRVVTEFAFPDLPIQQPLAADGAPQQATEAIESMIVGGLLGMGAQHRASAHEQLSALSARIVKQYRPPAQPPHAAHEEDSVPASTTAQAAAVYALGLLHEHSGNGALSELFCHLLGVSEQFEHLCTLNYNKEYLFSDGLYRARRLSRVRPKREPRRALPHRWLGSRARELRCCSQHFRFGLVRTDQLVEAHRPPVRHDDGCEYITLQQHAYTVH